MNDVAYWTHRLADRRYFVGLLIGCLIIIGHLISTIPDSVARLDGNEYLFTPYTQWLALHTDGWTIAFYFCLPITCALSFGQTVGEDRRSGFFWHVLPELSQSRVVAESLGVSFLGGALTAMIPLALDFGVLSCFLPLIAPDTVMNAALGVTTDFSFWPTLLFTSPGLWVLFYIGLAGAVGGGYALLASTSALFLRDRFSPLGIGFVGTMVLNVLNATLIQVAVSPVLFSIGTSPAALPALPWIIGFGGLSCLCLGIGSAWGVRRNAIR
ncbi:hypothetical protein [Lacticaseibacillus absianus]|uniref:hypothetical protein n=1 Tax=Lacticaseibacillus absianus TaxID=2729623 RepID=UPI0015CB7854|nr:hypothetical protein [Lacticaseibacillus absianus]